jgi:RNA polymerase sigma-54 factor
MNMGFRLSQEQVQKMVVTPELKQAIAMLQFSSQELLEYLEEEVAANPVVEWESPPDMEPLLPEVQKPREWDWADDHDDTEGLPRSYGSAREFPLEAVVRSTETLEEYLWSQLGSVRLSPQEKKVIRYLIGNMDERGYITVNDTEAAVDCGQPESVVARCLSYIHKLDPPGIGARNLKECLIIQAKELAPEEPRIVELIQEHLEDLAEGRIVRVAQKMKISPLEVQRLADIIKRFDPRPGRAFFQEPPRYIVPDVIVERVQDDYVVIVNDRLFPRLSISPLYRTLAARAAGQSLLPGDREAKEYIEHKMHAAVWLLKSLEQRRQTIYRVTEAIVAMQRGFFDAGVPALKPLTLKQVAEKVGLHESTVSRATSNKYVQTPRGVFELKFFFTSGLVTDEGGVASSASVKRRMKEIIAGEDPKSPFSDQKLAEILQGEGIRIQRRTVAKYREEMQIPSSSQRKRF